MTPQPKPMEIYLIEFNGHQKPSIERQFADIVYQRGRRDRHKLNAELAVLGNKERRVVTFREIHEGRDPLCDLKALCEMVKDSALARKIAAKYWPGAEEGKDE